MTVSPDLPAFQLTCFQQKHADCFVIVKSYFILATLLSNATQELCVGTVRSRDILQANAPIIQFAMCVVRWGTWLAIALTPVFQLKMQGSATTATSQDTLLFIARTRRPATTAVKLVTLPVTA